MSLHAAKHVGRVPGLLGLASGFALAVSANGCLPKDTRPPPAQVLFTATASPATRDGVPASATEDGWAISFERVLVSIGHASLDGDSCSTYAEAGYSRVLSLAGAPDGEKVSQSFALGQCDFGFGVSNPDSDSLLGVTASADDLRFLRTPGADRYAGPSGISLFVKGQANKAGLAKTFAWAFRGRVRYRQCGQLVDGVPVLGLKLGQNEHVTVDVVLHPEALFADNPDQTLAKLRFEPIAAADTMLGNDDGEVTLDELALVPFDGLQQLGAYPAGDAGIPFQTLEDFVYEAAAPSVARYRDDGTCTLRLGDMRGD